MQYKFKKLLALFTIILITGLWSCEKITIGSNTTIEYEEYAVFSEYVEPGLNGAASVKTFANLGEAFVVFTINSVKNTDVNASDFSFDPGRLFVNTTGNPKMEPGLPNSTTTAITIKAGATEYQLGRIIMMIPGINLNDILNSDHNLLYEPNGVQGVTFIRKAITKLILSPATPSNLPPIHYHGILPLYCITNNHSTSPEL